MAPPKKRSEGVLGHGTTIEFLKFGFIGQGTNFRASRGAVGSVEITNFDSPTPTGDREWGGSEFLATAVGDPGQISLTLVWKPDQKLPPIGEEGRDTVRVTTPLKSGFKTSTVFSGEAFLMSVDLSAETQTGYTAEVVIQRSGVWTETAAVRNS